MNHCRSSRARLINTNGRMRINCVYDNTTQWLCCVTKLQIPYHSHSQYRYGHRNQWTSSIHNPPPIPTFTTSPSPSPSPSLLRCSLSLSNITANANSNLNPYSSWWSSCTPTTNTTLNPRRRHRHGRYFSTNTTKTTTSVKNNLFSKNITEAFNPQHAISARFVRKRKKLQAVSHGDMILYVLSMWITMFGLAYLSAPLYRALCQRFGWGGSITRQIDKKMQSLVVWRESDDHRKFRKLLIRFDTRTGPGMPWEFTPVQNYIITRPGESTLAFFKARNTAKTPMTGLSTYTVLPFKAAPYFIKIQCFCFEEQRLRGNEELDMPVLFFVDPAILDDERCSDVSEVTLSYIFYPIVDDNEEIEYDDYENDPFYAETDASKEFEEKNDILALPGISSGGQPQPQLQM